MSATLGSRLSRCGLRCCAASAGCGLVLTQHNPWEGRALARRTTHSISIHRRRT
jgi:hypothetical protein